MELLGAYHDGRIQITYPGVREYSIFQPHDHGPHDPRARGHGDWLIDEVSPSDRGNPDFPLVIHEIVFSNRGILRIESQEILFEWLP